MLQSSEFTWIIVTAKINAHQFTYDRLRLFQITVWGSGCHARPPRGSKYVTLPSQQNTSSIKYINK